MRKLAIIHDANNEGMPGGLNVSTFIDARVLAATTAESHTIPSGAKSVRLTGTVPFFVNFAAAAAIPAADITDGSSSILVLTDRIFSIPSSATAIGLIASAICTITMEFYS